MLGTVALARGDRDEHALGLMTHGTRVVVGGADTSLLGWIAKRDRAGK
jgi:hypothetical protein